MDRLVQPAAPSFQPRRHPAGRVRSPSRSPNATGSGRVKRAARTISSRPASTRPGTLNHPLSNQERKPTNAVSVEPGMLQGEASDPPQHDQIALELRAIRTPMRRQPEAPHIEPLKLLSRCAHTQLSTPRTASPARPGYLAPWHSRRRPARRLSFCCLISCCTPRAPRPDRQPRPQTGGGGDHTNPRFMTHMVGACGHHPRPATNPRPPRRSGARSSRPRRTVRRTVSAALWNGP